MKEIPKNIGFKRCGLIMFCFFFFIKKCNILNALKITTFTLDHLSSCKPFHTPNGKKYPLEAPIIKRLDFNNSPWP